MKLIKGILMYSTAFSCLLYISAIDCLSLIAVFGWLTVNIALVCINIQLISSDEAWELSGMKWLDKVLKK